MLTSVNNSTSNEIPFQNGNMHKNTPLYYPLSHVFDVSIIHTLLNFAYVLCKTSIISGPNIICSKTVPK